MSTSRARCRRRVMFFYLIYCDVRRQSFLFSRGNVTLTYVSCDAVFVHTNSIINKDDALLIWCRFQRKIKYKYDFVWYLIEGNSAFCQLLKNTVNLC